jgi:hypothetical protein
MSGENATGVPKSGLKKFGKFCLVAAGCLVVLGALAHLIWKYSGSSQWEFVSDTRGVKLYSMKTPGSALKKFKGISHVRASLTSAMLLAQDPAVCEYAHCYESRMIERVDERLQYYTFRWKYPLKFKPREYVIKERFSRIPETKALLVEVIGDPDKLPPNDCCVRVRNMYNTWRFTPINDSELEIEYIINSDAGGVFPYFLANYAGPKFIPFVQGQMQTILDKEKEKYPNAKFELLAEK